MMLSLEKIIAVYLTFIIFEEDLKGLVIVEVEFDSIEEANAFTSPDWFGEDVTNSGKYHNSYLSQHGLA